MWTIWMWLTFIFIATAILSAIPGVRDIFRPLLEMTMALFVSIVKFFGGYVLWLFKSILNAHLDLLKHLFNDRKHFNPADGIDE